MFVALLVLNLCVRLLADDCSGDHREREGRCKKVWDLVQWQRGGLFSPGKRFTYSNCGYLRNVFLWIVKMLLNVWICWLVRNYLKIVKSISKIVQSSLKKTWTTSWIEAERFCNLHHFNVHRVVSQAPSVEVKLAWLNELRRILTNQQKLLRGLWSTKCVDFKLCQLSSPSLLLFSVFAGNKLDLFTFSKWHEVFWPMQD